VALEPVVRSDGEQQGLRRIDPVPLAEVRLQALELLPAGAVRDDVQVLEPGPACELDVLVGVRVEDELVEVAEPLRQIVEVGGIGGVLEAREAAGREHGSAADLLQHRQERIGGPLLRGIGHHHVEAAPGDEGPVALDLARDAVDGVARDVELLDPRTVELGLVTVRQPHGRHRHLVAAAHQLSRRVPDHGLGSPRTRVVELDAVQDLQGHSAGT
jgi:hypothetical protein